MRVVELIQYLMDHANMNDTVFVNATPAKCAMNGVGYVSITEYMIEQRQEILLLNGTTYEIKY